MSYNRNVARAVSTFTCLGIKFAIHAMWPMSFAIPRKSTHPHVNELQHRLEVIRHLERCLRLRLDLVHRNTIRNLDKGQTVGEVDIKDTL